jgi:hypothetical protein
VAKKLIIKTTKNQTKTNNDQREQTLTTEDEQHYHQYGVGLRPPL